VRECLNDIRIYNADTEETKKIKANPQDLCPRRAAAGTMVGRSFIVHGGIDAQGKYLRDIWSFDLNQYRW
jgi:Galactose oxidase, central domain